MRDIVNFQHPLYRRHIDQVQTVNDIYNGIDTAKTHLMQQGRETSEGFERRQELATLRNFVKRSVEAFVGMIFRKQVQTSGYPDELLPILNKIDKTNTLNRFSRLLGEALVRDGHVFVGVDSEIGGSDPYAVLYYRSQVINWRKDETGRYTMLVVEEEIEDNVGEFESVYLTQWRHYDDNGNVTIYRNNENGELIQYGETIITDFDGIAVVEFVLSDIPPLYDVAKLNIKHMNRTSLKDKYLDMSATPIPLIWGIDTPDPSSSNGGTQPVYVIGVDEAFLFTGSKDENDFQWRELDGSSISVLQDDLAVIEEEITSGVIRAVQSDNTTIKTATQSFYEAAEAANRVTVIANAVESGLNRVVAMLADILEVELDDTAQVIVNKDFNAIAQNNDELRLLWEVYLSGGISISTFLNTLERYEVIDIGSVENEITRIEKETFVPKPRVQNTNTVFENSDNRTQSVMGD